MRSLTRVYTGGRYWQFTKDQPRVTDTFAQILDFFLTLSEERNEFLCLYIGGSSTERSLALVCNNHWGRWDFPFGSSLAHYSVSYTLILCNGRDEAEKCTERDILWFTNIQRSHFTPTHMHAHTFCISLPRFLDLGTYTFVLCDYWSDVCLPTRLYVSRGQGLNTSCCWVESKTKRLVWGLAT